MDIARVTQRRSRNLDSMEDSIEVWNKVGTSKERVGNWGYLLQRDDQNVGRLGA